LLDRGSDSKKILNLLIKLKKQTKIKGGKIKLLLGNHELLNLQGSFDYTVVSDILDYGNVEDRMEEFAIKKKYGKLLRTEMKTIMVIDDILFTHAG